MIFLYRILILPFLLLASPYYLRRMLKRGGYRENFAQRFGAVPSLPPKKTGVKRVWLQAVSVGEMLAIAPLLEGLTREGNVEVYLSTTTSTGYKLAGERYSKLVLGIGYFPIDCLLFSMRAWKRVQPDLVILTEGERWPEHIHQAKSRGVPVISVNARMSDRGYNRMRKVRPLILSLFSGITRFLPCSNQDAERLTDLGFPASRITRTGNIKLDIKLVPLDLTALAQLRKELGLPEGLVLLGSSTWPGEEAAMLTAFKKARETGLQVSLLLVPRHAERREEVRALLRDSGFTHHFRSKGVSSEIVDVAVGDTTGELRKLTQLADVVFVGKSLPPHHEGQTPVEAAALGRPVLFGPEMSNFREIARELVAGGAAGIVCNESELSAQVCALLQDATRRQAMSQAGRLWHQTNQGAVERTLAIIRHDLGL